MAHIKSQIKRNRKNEEQRRRNKAVRTSLKTSIRKFNASAAAGNVDEATVRMRSACRQLDKAASKGIIHKNQAANRKSSLARRADALRS